MVSGIVRLEILIHTREKLPPYRNRNVGSKLGMPQNANVPDGVTTLHCADRSQTTGTYTEQQDAS